MTASVSDPIAIYQAIAAREKASRHEAERLLEEKSRELYYKNREIARSAAELAEAHGLLSEVMAVAPDGILLCSEDGAITSANARGARMLGCPVEALAGRGLVEFLPGLGGVVQGAREGGFSVPRGEARTDAGTRFPVEIRGHAGRIHDRYRILVFFTDISDRLREEERRKQIDRQVEEARRLESIGALSAGIAHEINTPIQFVGDNLDYLREAFEQIERAFGRYDALRDAAAARDAFPHERAEIDAVDAEIDLPGLRAEIAAALSESRDGIRQVRDIVLLMKEFSHPGSITREACDLNEIIRSVVTLSKGRQKDVVTVELDLCAGLPPLDGRRGHLQQTLLNLVMNALDAVEEVEQGARRVRVATGHDGAHLRIAVSDTGPGVPAALREKIFDPFFTTKPVGKGTGQGLALAKDCIVKGHGGRLSLAGLDGFATTFLIELPRTDLSGPATEENSDGLACEADPAGR